MFQTHFVYDRMVPWDVLETGMHSKSPRHAFEARQELATSGQFLTRLETPT